MWKGCSCNKNRMIFINKISSIFIASFSTQSHNISYRCSFPRWISGIQIIEAMSLTSFARNSSPTRVASPSFVSHIASQKKNCDTSSEENVERKRQWFDLIRTIEMKKYCCHGLNRIKNIWFSDLILPHKIFLISGEVFGSSSYSRAPVNNKSYFFKVPSWNNATQKRNLIILLYLIY